MKFRTISLCFFVLIVSFGNSQTTDLARVEYTYAPQSDSDNSFRRFRTFINFPIPLAEDNYLVPGIEYRNVNIKLRDDLPFNNENRERYQSIKVSLGYTAAMKNDWRYAFTGDVIMASDFAGKVQSDDFIYGGAVFFIKDQKGEDADVKKPWRLIIGLSYSTTAGRPFPLPIINYNRRIHENWSYTLGVPKTNIKYFFNEKHIIQAFVTLDGFFANIQDNIDLQTDGVADSISMTTVLSGVGYEYNFTDHLLFYVYAGRTLLNDIRLRDRDAQDVLTLNAANTFYGRTGIKFKI